MYSFARYLSIFVFLILLVVFGHPCTYVNISICHVISCHFHFLYYSGIHYIERIGTKHLGKHEGQRNGQLLHRGKLFILKWVIVCKLFSISERKVSLCLTGALVMFLDWDPKHNTLNPSTFQTLNIPVAFPQSDKA